MATNYYKQSDSCMSRKLNNISQQIKLFSALVAGSITSKENITFSVKRESPRLISAFC